MFDDLRELAVEAIRVGGGTTVRTIRVIMQRLSLIARLAIAWPLLLLFVAMPGYGFAQYAVPIITTSVLLALLWVITKPGSLGIMVAQEILPTISSALGFSPMENFLKKAKEATKSLRFVLGIELLTGIYFSIVPIANDPLLALILILVGTAIVCFVGINKNVVVGLVLVFCAITLIFYLGGRDNLHLKNVFAGHSKPSPSCREEVAIEKPRASARPEPQTNTAKGKAGATVPTAQANWYAEEWLKPTSGDEGSFIVRVAPCRYTFGRVVGCKIYVQPPQGFESQQLYLNDLSGLDDQGTFNAWVNGVNSNYIRFRGGSYPGKLEAGMRTPIELSVERPDGVTQLGFDLLISTGGAWIRYSFTMIPVKIN